MALRLLLCAVSSVAAVSLVAASAPCTHSHGNHDHTDRNQEHFSEHAGVLLGGLVHPMRCLLSAFGSLQHPLCVIQRALQLRDILLRLLDRATTHAADLRTIAARSAVPRSLLFVYS